MLCRLIIGNRGSGKSIGMEMDIVGFAGQGVCAVAYIDLPGTGVRRLTGHMWANGFDHLVEYIYAAPRDGKYYPFPFVVQPPNDGTLISEVDAENAIDEMAEAFFAKKGMKGTDNAPLIKKWVKLGLRVWSRCDPVPPLKWLPKVFARGTAEHAEMMGRSKDQDAVRQFKEIEEIKNPTIYIQHTGPASRMFDICESAAVWPHHGPNLDFEKELLNKKHLYFDLSGVSHEQARTLGVTIANRIENTCRDYFARTGKPLHVIVIFEEAGALDLATPQVRRAMKEGRKYGYAAWVVSQTLQDFKEPEVLEELMALCDEHHWYRCNSGLDRIGKDLADPTWDDKIVHYTREQMVHAGYEKVSTTSHQHSTSREHGQKHARKNEGTTESFQYRAVYQPQTIEHYKSSQVHEADWRQKVSCLGTFERITRDLLGVRKERPVVCLEIWPNDSSEAVIDRAIQSIRSRPHYQPPKLPEPKPQPLPDLIQFEQPKPEKPAKPRGAAARSRGKSGTG